MAGVVFYGLLSWFLVRYLSNTDWEQLGRLDLSPVYLMAALPLSLLPRFLQPVAWRELIRGYGDNAPPYAQITRVYALSWMGRYIPGKVAWIGAKVIFGREYGIRATTLVATGIAEAVLHLATALALSFLIILLGRDVRGLGAETWMLTSAAFAVMCVLLLPPVFNALMTRALVVARSPLGPGIGRLSGVSLVRSTMLYLAIHALSGLPTYLVVKSIYPAIGASQIPEMTAAFLLAGTMGTLALFAPSGLGVREGILIVLLGFLMPKHIAVAGVVLLRLWSIAMDLAYYALAVLFDRVRPMPGGRRVTAIQ